MAWRFMTRLLLGTAAIATVAAPLSYGQPADISASTAPASAGATRTLPEIQKDLQATSVQLNKALPPLQSLLDAPTREKAAPVTVPLLWKMLSLFDEAAVAAPKAKPSLHLKRIEFLAILSVLKDAKANQLIADDLASTDPISASEGKNAKAIADWFNNHTDAAAQTKILDDVAATVKTQPTANEPVQALAIMSEVGAASPELKKRATGIILTDSQSSIAKLFQAHAAEQAKQEQVVNQPMVIAGKTIDSKDFTSADWKGKVVLVDFWATWCGPCKAGLPEVKKIYADNHSKGLEIIGVSSDLKPEDLKDFLAGNPDMPWPQLFEPNTTHHPLLDKYNIEGIPTMYLIDRNGICRSVTAREDMQELIPKLLAEKPGDKPTASVNQ